MKVIIPMAGLGTRFANKGFKNPKPFIDIYGQPMIRRVVDSINLPQVEHIFIARQEHIEEFNLADIFSDLNIKILPIHETTEGAAISVSMTRKFFRYDEEILIVNSDQLFHYDSRQVADITKQSVDGCIWCFYGNGPKWSYVKVDSNNLVTEVAEKKQISNIATGGMYYWKSFYNFLDCTDQMVEANDRVNNEFYVAPVYNYMQPFQKTVTRMLNGIDQLGTPEDLQEYENKICVHRDYQLL